MYVRQCVNVCKWVSVSGVGFSACMCMKAIGSQGTVSEWVRVSVCVYVSGCSSMWAQCDRVCMGSDSVSVC